MVEGKKIVILIPALNEEENIAKVLKALPDFVDTIIVVDDGSTDNTAGIARENGAVVVSHPYNKGVGAAFSTGVEEAIRQKADVMVNIDADGQFNPADIIQLVEPIIQGRAEFVTASRFKDKSLYPEMSKIKFKGNKFMSWFISKLTRSRFYDVSCGFRAYTRETLLRLNLFGDFTYTQESFIDLASKKVRILEIPVKVRGRREHGKSRVASNLFRYAFQTLKIIVRTYRDYHPFKLFGFVALLSLIAALGFGGFLLVHYVQTGFFTPHKWAGFVSGFFGVFSLILLLIGFILDMFSRMRKNQEEIMFLLKKQGSDD